MASFEITHDVDRDSLLEFTAGLDADTEKQFSQFKDLDDSDIIKKVYDTGRHNFFLKLEGILAGYAFLAPKNHHVVNFGLVITPKYQKLGYGPLLLQYLINWARNAKYKKIWGACFEDNKEALNLYRRMGFVCEGAFMNEEYNDNNGQYRHLYSLAKYLHIGSSSENWSRNPKWLIDSY